jgi:hypothetical protein
LNALIEHDRLACQYLQRIVSKSGFSVFLARMTHHKQKVVKGSKFRACLDYAKLEHVYSCRGNLVVRDLDIGKHELPSQLQDGEDHSDACQEEDDINNPEDRKGAYTFHHTVSSNNPPLSDLPNGII